MRSGDLPNVLFITSHDTGDWLNCYGHKTVRTPHLDALAAQGCRFDASFCTSPVCTPSRGALMTGRYPQSNGLMGLIQTPYRWRFADGERHLSHLLSEIGYHTVLFNHQHEAEQENTLGFEELRIHDVGMTRLLTRERVSTAREVADEFRTFLRDGATAKRPFYAQLGFFETHTAYDWNGAVPDAVNGIEIPPFLVDDEEAQSHVAALQGSILSLDDAVGDILAGLDESGEGGNTIVVFTVDHGVELPHCKWELYDGGMKTALLVRWQDGSISRGETCPWLISNIDVVPTILDLIGIPPPQNVQGKSFAGFFGSYDDEKPRNSLFAMMHANQKWIESRCVRTDKHKLIRNFSSGRATELPTTMGAPEAIQERPVVELYDLDSDPYELENLAGTEGFAEIRLDLDKRLHSWMNEVRDPVLEGPIRTPYYDMAISDFLSSR